MTTPQVRAPESYRATSLSADTLVKTGEGFIYGILVTASAAGVIKLWDNTAASGTVLIDSYSVVAGDFIPCPVQFDTGLYFDLISGTATVTIFYI